MSTDSRESRWRVPLRVGAAAAVLGLGLIWWSPLFRPAEAPKSARPTLREVPAPGHALAVPPRSATAESVEAAAGAAREAALALLEGAFGSLQKLEHASLRELIDLALDPEASLELRVAAVRRLAERGSDEAVEVLARVLHGDAPSVLKAEVAAALGASPHPEARRLLDSLLEIADEKILRGAIRGLAATGDPAVVGTLEGLLLDESQPAAVRAQAAVSLGSLGTPRAAKALREALGRSGSDEWVASLLEGLGQLPYGQIEDVFRAVLKGSEFSGEIKVAALEALGDSSPDAAPLLLDYAERAPEAELRVAAVEALAFLEDVPGLPDALLGLLETEQVPDVRAELYRTLALFPSETYAGSTPPALVGLIEQETTAEARRHGVRLVASVLRRHPDPRLSEPFDRAMVPWLREQALHGGGRYARLVSVDTLKIASTQGANQALLDLAHARETAVASAAAEALRLAKGVSSNRGD